MPTSVAVAGTPARWFLIVLAIVMVAIQYASIMRAAVLIPPTHVRVETWVGFPRALGF